MDALHVLVTGRGDPLLLSAEQGAGHHFVRCQQFHTGAFDTLDEGAPGRPHIGTGAQGQLLGHMGAAPLTGLQIAFADQQLYGLTGRHPGHTAQ